MIPFWPLRRGIWSPRGVQILHSAVSPFTYRGFGLWDGDTQLVFKTLLSALCSGMLASQPSFRDLLFRQFRFKRSVFALPGLM